MYSKKNDCYYFRKINTDKISIRELNLEDENALFELFSNDNVTKNLSIVSFKSNTDASKLIERAIEHYKKGEIFYLGIINRYKNVLIGYIGLSKYDLSVDTCQVVYALNENYWGKGIMVEALKLFIDYLFSVQNKKTIIATHIDRNVNSGKVMLKAGMQRDKNYDQEMIIKGKVEKLIGYSIKKE